MSASAFTASPRTRALPAVALPPQEPALADLFASVPAETLVPGRALFWECDVAAHAFQVLEGCLRLYRILPDGRRAIMGFAFGKELLGVAVPQHYLSTAEAVTPVRVRRLGRSRFRAAAEASPRLRAQVFDTMFREMSAVQDHMVVLGRLGAEERVANFLVSTACRTNADQKSPIRVDLPMSRLDIADYLGLTIETVCRALSKLRRDGLVEPMGRHGMILRRMADLRFMAGHTDEDDSMPEVRPVAIRPAVWPNPSVFCRP